MGQKLLHTCSEYGFALDEHCILGAQGCFEQATQRAHSLYCPHGLMQVRPLGRAPGAKEEVLCAVRRARCIRVAERA